MKKKRQMLLLTLLAIVSIALWAPDAGAYTTVSNCLACHTDFADGSTSNAHQGHLGLGLPQSCNACHAIVGDTPVTSTCGACHVEPGLPLHHIGAGAGTCDECHPFNSPGKENDPVPGYVGLSVTLDPCNGSEERYSSFTVSLDNDGDGLYDQNDPDCLSQVETNCSDGIDNDGDGLIDCNDQDCANDPVCQLPATETNCIDGIDNDGDGFVDCTDSDCTNDPVCQPETEKITICHIPPGKPTKAKTITIDRSSVSNHLAHGDYIGECN